MRQIRADGAENILCPLVAALGQRLYGLELLRGGQPLVQRDAGGGRELDDGVLREILAAHAPVAGPFVDGGRFAQIDRRERQLVEPAEQIAAAVNVPCRLTRTHGKAHDAAVLQTHRARERGHVAVVGDDDRHVADLFGRAVIDGLDLLALRARDLQKQRGDHRAVAHERPRGRDADAVDTRQLGSGGLEGADDAVILVAEIL